MTLRQMQAAILKSVKSNEETKGQIQNENRTISGYDAINYARPVKNTRENLR
jgi:hypothetical protein